MLVTFPLLPITRHFVFVLLPMLVFIVWDVILTWDFIVRGSVPPAATLIICTNKMEALETTLGMRVMAAASDWLTVFAASTTFFCGDSRMHIP